MRCEKCGRFLSACICDKPVQKALEGIGTDTYPAQGSEQTSRDAYYSLNEVRGSLRRNVYEVLLNTLGATSEEIEDATGLDGNTVRPRLKELEEGGYAFKGAVQRKTRSGRDAIVWEPQRKDAVPVEIVAPLPGQERLL